MFRRLILVPMVALFISTFAVPADAGSMRDDGIHTETWMEAERHDMAAAAKAAADSGKTLLVVVEGPGCTACASMHRTHFADEKYVAFLNKHFDVHLMSTAGERNVTDVEGNKVTETNFVRMNQVRGTPTLMFLDAKGEEFFRIPGLPEDVYFRAFIDYVADGSAAKELSLEKWWAANEAKVRARHNI